MTSLMTIGQLAARAGLKTSAIRYYEREGVLPPADRISGQRRYTAETLRWLGIIDTAKRAGFSLQETRLLLDRDQKVRPHEQLRELAEHKLPQIDALIARAQAMRAWLASATRCSCESLEACRLFDEHSPAAEVLALAVYGGAPQDDAQ